MFLIILLFLISLVITLYLKTSLIYSFLLMILKFVYLFYKLCLSIPLFFLRRRTPTCATQLIGDIKCLDKVPKHLAIMFWSDDVQEERLIEVARLCCWSLCFGVKIVSIHDPEGHLKNHARSIQSYVDTISQKFFISEKIIPSIQITSLGSPSINSSTEIEPDLLVNLVSRSDGRARITKITKSLTEDIIQEKLKYDDVNVRELDKRLSIPQFPEPQLLILFSPKIILDGFPPWHIHLTEIFHVPDNQNFSYFIFLQGLRKYSKCTHRFGK